ncbi:MAG TPA: hypothetical protein DCM73_10385 [Clostridiales bacterium]|nr:hypothetical protein [Clostridiales bacterium]
MKKSVQKIIKQLSIVKKIKISRAVILAVLFLAVAPLNAAADSYSYSVRTINEKQTSYVTIDMNDKTIKPVMMTAGGNLSSVQSVRDMAVNNEAFAAVNGTYFEAYSGVPVPWGTIIQEGKVIHMGNYGAVAGFTADGRLIVDRLKIEFKGYINDVYRSIPWRINHPSTEDESITIFTPEYNTPVSVKDGAKAVVVQNGAVTNIVSADFNVPYDGFAIVYNKSVSHLVDERFKIGDKVRYESIISTSFTDASQWNDVVTAVGAGPSLIINGQITADGAAEGFSEAKINSVRAFRSFIGANEAGKVVIGNITSSTLKEAAEVCRSMGLVNAMCLDGGGSVGLYYNGVSKASGRNVNNALGFIKLSSAPAGKPVKEAAQQVLVDKSPAVLSSYNIDGYNYFKLRDIAVILKSTQKEFEVSWDESAQCIALTSGKEYTSVGGELEISSEQGSKYAAQVISKIKFGEKELSLPSYNIDGYNYFKLRDVGDIIDFVPQWDTEAKVIKIVTE